MSSLSRKKSTMIFIIVLIFFGFLTDFCDGCNVGYYGESCSKECPKFCHDSECNVTSGKCLSCAGGYYSDINEDCILCPENCTACSSEKYCFACKSGFRGEVCDDVCTNCKPYISCDKKTGYCLEKCSEGLSGEDCNIKCDPKCESCDRHNETMCISCNDGDIGKVCEEECLMQCLRITCNESRRSCEYECSSGYQEAKRCNQTCLSYCKERVCNTACKELVQPDIPSSSTSKANIGLISGLVIGVVFIICFFVIVYIKVRRRITKKRHCKYMSSDTNRTLATNDHELLPLDAGRTTETRELPSAEKLTVLQMQRTFSAIEEKYDNMKINVAGNKVTVEGDPLDIEHAFIEICINFDKIQHVQYKHSKSRVVYFLPKGADSRIRKKEAKTETVVWNLGH